MTPFFDVPKIEHRRFSAIPCIKNRESGPKGQYKGPNWPEALERQDQAGPKDQGGPKSQYIRTKLARIETQIRKSNLEFKFSGQLGADDFVLMYWPFGLDSRFFITWKCPKPAMFYFWNIKKRRPTKSDLKFGFPVHHLP